MTSIATKALIIGGCMTGATVVGGTAYYLTKKDNKELQKGENQIQSTNQQTKPKKAIKDLLKAKQKAILTKDRADNEKWKTKWATFKGDYENLKTSNSSWVIAEYDSKHKNQREAPEVFKDKCIANGELEVVEESEKLFKDVVKYCVGDA